MMRSQTPDDRRHRPDIECPVKGCKQRFLSADGAGRHLDIVHDEAGRWRTDRYQAVDNVDGGDLVIYDRTNGEAWVQSSYYVEVDRQ